MSFPWDYTLSRTHPHHDKQYEVVSVTNSVGVDTELKW
jgi:hypothetical protein